MATNPLPIYIPCHRVIKSDGNIGNYGGGVERKLKLLRAEGFEVDRGDRVPPHVVYGHWQSRIFCQPTCSAVRRAERKKWIIFTDSDACARGRDASLQALSSRLRWKMSEAGSRRSKKRRHPSTGCLRAMIKLFVKSFRILLAPHLLDLPSLLLDLALLLLKSALGLIVLHLLILHWLPTA